MCSSGELSVTTRSFLEGAWLEASSVWFFTEEEVDNLGSALPRAQGGVVGDNREGPADSPIDRLHLRESEAEAAERRTSPGSRARRGGEAEAAQSADGVGRSSAERAHTCGEEKASS